MQFIHDILRTRLLHRAGIFDLKPILKIITLEELEKEIDMVWCDKFFVLMRNRLKMGRLRYGKHKGQSSYNLVGAIEAKLKLYKQTGNDELMVDIGNYAMLQFSIGTHPNKHFSAHDDSGTHAKKL